MKVLLTGAGGLLGQEIWKRLEGDPHQELFAIGRQQPGFVPEAQWLSCDLTNAARTYTQITKLNPEVIIHCAAYNAVDKAEAEPDEAYRMNALATRNVALACQRFDATLMSVSSDYVFDGEDAPPSGYREIDVCKPISRYGESKRWGELFVQQLLSHYFIVRTSWLFGPGRPTWVDQVRHLLQEGKTVYAITDMVSSPTYTPDLAEALVRLAQSRHYGLYHLTNQGFVSRADLAEQIQRAAKIKVGTIEKRMRAQLKLPAARPAFSGLENLAWRLDGFAPLRSWKEALHEHLESSNVRSRE